MSLQIIWDTHKNVLIRDINVKWQLRICEFMVEHYFKPHRLYEQLHFQDEFNINNEYLFYLIHILKNECSIVVLDEEANEIYGVALVRWMTKEWRSWTQFGLIVETGKWAEIIDLRRKMILNYANENPDHIYDSLHLFEYYINDELKSDEVFMAKFFNAICEVGRHMGMPRVTFMAMSIEEQAHADDAGWTELTRIIYSMYLVNGRRPFAALRNIEEMFTALYEKDLRPLTPYYEMTVREEIIPQQFNPDGTRPTLKKASITAGR